MVKLLPIFILVFCFSRIARAQSDTSNYDLGRILVKKQFTENITVKAHDLEKLQFSDLVDAINVWFYGTYSKAPNLVYVIDGNIISDVNVYSIYDIDEITLVQNALGQVSGASPSQQMVLIKLKTEKPGKQGITAAGQTSLVNIANTNNTQGEKSSSRFYDNYYASGFKNFSNFSLGLSADYQRDAFPQMISSISSSQPPFYFNRLKLNLWGTADLGSGNTITIGANYTPQASNISDSYTLFNQIDNNYSESAGNSGHISQHLFNATFSLKSNMSDLLTGLSNTFSLAYNRYNYFQNVNSTYLTPDYYDILSGYYNLATSGKEARYEYDNSSAFLNTDDLLIRDYLVYSDVIGDFEIEPSLNFSFRSVHNSTSYSSLTNVFAENSNNSAGALLDVSSSDYGVKGQIKNDLLTPSLNIVYKHFLNLQGGFVGILNYDKLRLLPFLTFSGDAAKIPGFHNLRLKIFGSFSKQNQILDDPYSTLAGFTLINYPNTAPAFLIASSGDAVQTSTYLQTNQYQQYNNYQAGFRLDIPRNFNVNYSFEYHSYETLYEEQAEGFVTQTLTSYPIVRSITNRLGLEYYLASNSFSWRTGLNMTESKLQVTDIASIFDVSSLNNYLSEGHRWSGGFTNRFDYQAYFLGIDLLYQIGERQFSILTANSYSSNYVAPNNTNSFSLQNIYFGKEISIRYLRHANIFLTGRNILQNKASDFTDNRRFFGFGFKGIL